MQFTLLALAMASSALAAPWSPSSYSNGNKHGYGNGNQYGHCLSQAQANKLVAEYAAVIAQQPSDLGNASYTAMAITTPNYMEYSDSANQQIGIPLGAATVPSQAVFVQSSQASPPVVQDTIEIYVADCNKIVWQWIDTTFGTGAYQIKGFHLFYVNKNYKLIKTYFEFNSFAGALDVGDTIYLANGTQFQ